MAGLDEFEVFFNLNDSMIFSRVISRGLLAQHMDSKTIHSSATSLFLFPPFFFLMIL